MNKSFRNLTPLYSFIQATYWMCGCVAVSFASVYLLKLGYSNTELGIVLALSNLLGILVGLVLSAKLDSQPKLKTTTPNSILFLLGAITQVYLYFFADKDLLTAMVYVLSVAVNVATNPLNVKLCIDLHHEGHSVNFSFARGIGSVGYMVLSVALGYLVSDFSIRILPVACFLCYVFELLLNMYIGHYVGSRYTSSTQANADSMLSFFQHNRYFMLCMFGISIMFFGHNTFSNFLVNCVEGVGGNTITMGNLIAFRALLELPVMFFYPKIRKNRDIVKLLQISLIFFLAKSFGTAIAWNVPSLYAVQLLQSVSFALYTAVIVDYTALVVRYEDSAKAQTISTSVNTVGSVLASLIAGHLFDIHSSRLTLFIAAIATMFGVIITLIGIHLEKIDTQSVKEVS